ncbi:MAG: hypothetical protein ACTSWX_01955, partial [Promethearchaeota archaeon]
YYPPKYVISLANKFVNGKELSPSLFNGGKESNDYLSKLGFRIVDISSKKSSRFKNRMGRCKNLRIHHDERCQACKITIGKLLKKIYGEVKSNYKFEVGTYPENFSDSSYYFELKKIYEALQNYRGFKNFIIRRTLPSCDFFVPSQGIIVEFDESQHFTIPRKITLEHYPSELELGFSRKKWIAQCKKIQAKDNNPPYRDEQRAWYDTLRDFLPSILGLRPIVRLLATDFKWCSLDPNNQSHISIFKNFLRNEIRDFRIEIREDSEPFLARVIIAGDWEGHADEAKKLLEDICMNWPKGKKVKFIVTCGGFIQFDWPKSLSAEEVGNNKYPKNIAINTLIAEAEKCINLILSDGLDFKLREITDYITFGVDSRKQKISMTQNFISQPHIELVCLIDLRKDKFYWTGKSYPTTNQERGLVRISDYESHFFDLKDIGKIMILGCHDLSIFNNRNWNKTGEWRKNIKIKFRDLAKGEEPICVLHHPHTTVKKRTWLISWNNLKKILPSVNCYFGCGMYYEPNRESSKYDSIEKVLVNTKLGSSIDVIVWINN